MPRPRAVVLYVGFYAARRGIAYWMPRPCAVVAHVGCLPARNEREVPTAQGRGICRLRSSGVETNVTDHGTRPWHRVNRKAQLQNALARTLLARRSKGVQNRAHR